MNPAPIDIGISMIGLCNISHPLLCVNRCGVNIKNQISKIKNCLFAIYFCLSIVTPLRAAEWKTYTNTNFIDNIIGDSLNLYCATQGGFAIFSRTESAFVRVYTNVDGLPVNRIQSLMYDRWGNIWLGTHRGIAIYDPTTEKVSTYDRLEQNNIISCFARSGDTILVGTQNGLFVIDTKGTTSIDDDTDTIIQSPFSCKIFSAEASNDFWVGACPGVVKLNRNLQTYIAYPHPFGDSVKAMTVVSDTLYIATEQGIAKYNASVFIPVVYFPQSYSVFDLQYSNNSFYVATTDGLFRYDGQSLTQILNQDTRTIFISDGLWVGLGGLISMGGGLIHYYNGIGQSYLSPGLASNIVSCAITDTLGSIYVMHYLTYWGNKVISYKKFYTGWHILHDTIINSDIGLIDKNNCIWFGHWALDGGVSCYNPSQNTWQEIMWTASHYRNVIAAIGVDRRNVKWTYNQYNTIIAIDSAWRDTVEFNIPGLSRPERGEYEFAFDLQNRVWLGASVGLVMIDYNNTLSDQSDDTYKIYRQGLPDQEVNSVAVDAQNRVWCATVQGAAMLASDSFRIYNMGNSPILSDKVVRIKTDSWGNVWFLCPNGLSQYNIYTKEWVSYTPENSGLIPNVENDDKFYRWLFVDEQKRFLLIATKEGISQFFYEIPAPESLSQIRIYPNPFIANEHQVITFDSLPEGASIKIYSIEGKFITELTSNPSFAGVRWEPKSIASGIYLAVVSVGGKTQISKFAIIR